MVSLTVRGCSLRWRFWLAESLTEFLRAAQGCSAPRAEKPYGIFPTRLMSCFLFWMLHARPCAHSPFSSQEGKGRSGSQARMYGTTVKQPNMAPLENGTHWEWVSSSVYLWWPKKRPPQIAAEGGFHEMSLGTRNLSSVLTPG